MKGKAYLIIVTHDAFKTVAIMDYSDPHFVQVLFQRVDGTFFVDRKPKGCCIQINKGAR